MITKAEAETRVARGTAHLDVVRPGWFNRIDVGTLTLIDPCGCIVGQLCGSKKGDFNENVERCGLTAGAFGTAVTHGFDVNMRDTDYFSRSDEACRRLQSAWIESIADRRLSTTVESQTANAAVGLSVLQPVAVHART